MSNASVLIDTSVWILYLRGEARAKEPLGKLLLEEQTYTSEIILFEILRGAKSKKDFGILQRDFGVLPRIVLSQKVWQSAFSIGFELRKSGINVPTSDTLIAALALSRNCLLLHEDKHFPLIAERYPLKCMTL